MVRKPYAVEIHWVDSAFHRGWTTLETKQNEMRPASCCTVGYMVRRDTTSICVVASLGDTDAADGISIPTVAVKKVRRLR